MAEALRRLPPSIIVGRNCRLRRALDLSLKHEALPKDLLAKQTPELSYLQVGHQPGRCRKQASDYDPNDWGWWGGGLPDVQTCNEGAACLRSWPA